MDKAGVRVQHACQFKHAVRELQTREFTHSAGVDLPAHPLPQLMHIGKGCIAAHPQ